MRLREMLSEALRNVGSGTSRAVLLFLIALVAGTALGGCEAASVIGQESAAFTRVAALANADAVVGGTVDGASCDALSQGESAAFAASGALRASDELTMLSTPGQSLASYEVTPGLLELIAANDAANGGEASLQADATGIWVSQELAADFGFAVGSEVATDKGTSRIAGIFAWPNDGRDTRFGYAFLVPAAASGATFTECWATQWPHSDDDSQLLYATLKVGESPVQAGVMAVNKGFDAHYDAAGEYLGRATRWMPWIAAALGIAIGIASVRQRRLELAGALHVGESRASLLATLCAETLLWGTLATLSSALLLAGYCARSAPVEPLAAFAGAVRSPLALFAGILLATLVSAACVRESQLFRLFKQR